MPKFQKQLFSYYNERAEEYDEIYEGKGPAIPDSDAYKKDEAKIIKMVSNFGKGHLIDIGCGTGFWLSYYAPNCSKITLLDQSERMLIECKKRIDKLKLKDKCEYFQGDFFEISFGKCLFDSALIGFFISHLTPEKETIFFEKLKKILKFDAKIMIIDSAWSEKRKQFRKKKGLQERILHNGKKFTIYKRYFDKNDVNMMFAKHALKLDSIYIGKVFLSAIGGIEIV